MQGKVCKFCSNTESDKWWKCCPEHCSEQGEDVVCETCVKDIHRLCLVSNCCKLGIEKSQIFFQVYKHGVLAEHNKSPVDVYLCEDHRFMLNISSQSSSGKDGRTIITNY